MPAIIETQNLSKTYRVLEGKGGFLGAMRNLLSRKYRVIEAVKNLNLSIEQGTVCGMIGPNGAGKSTTIKLLTGILVPDSGSVSVLGIEPATKRTQNALQIAVVFGQRTKLWWDLPCMESFSLHRDMYRIPSVAFQSRVDEFKELLGIDEFWKTPVRQLSLGQRMRAEIALSMLHDPTVVFLDEPSIGLDAIAKERVRQFIRERNRTNGTTFVITSHDMADIEKLCSRVLIIDHGTVVHDGTLQRIVERFGTGRELQVEFRDEPDSLDLPFGQVVEDRGVIKTIRFARSEGTSIDLISFLGERNNIKDVSIKEADIEAVIRAIYERR